MDKENHRMLLIIGNIIYKYNIIIIHKNLIFKGLQVTFTTVQTLYYFFNHYLD